MDGIDNMKTSTNIVEDLDVGIQVNTTPIINLGLELQDLKKVNEVIVVNHDSSTNMNFGSDIKGVDNKFCTCIFKCYSNKFIIYSAMKFESIKMEI